MLCLGCGYSLKGLTDPRCPECGREFDSLDPRTFGKSAPSARRRRFVVFALIGAYPLLPSILLLIMWTTAWITLGHPPRVNVDDPMRISGQITSMHHIVEISHDPLPLSFLLLIFLLPIHSRTRDPQLRAASRRALLLSGLAWGTFVALMWSRIGGWYAD
jgi:hypothetical protein